MASNVGTVNVNLAYGRCKDCKWWDSSTESEELETGHAPELKRIPVLQNKCECPKITDMSNSCPSEGRLWSELAPDEAGYRDCEGCNAVFRTGPDFGCIHHEEKP